MTRRSPRRAAIARRNRRVPLLALSVATALGATGCGVGAGRTPDDVRLRVSDGFGVRLLLQEDRPAIKGEDTVMRLLQRNADVQTAFGGRFVSAIGDRAGGESVDGSSEDWIYFVNGVRAGHGAAGVRVDHGDRIWWDRHDTRMASVGAVVGSFPAPLNHDRTTLDVACAAPAAASCRTAVRRLRSAGVRAAVRGLTERARAGRVRVLVGAWPALRRQDAAAPLARGPRASGVLAVPARGGLVAYDRRGRAGSRLRQWGLVAALRPLGSPVTWLVTGATERDATSAAAALREPALRGRFAVLVRGGDTSALPIGSAR